MRGEALPEWKFDGADINHERDSARLTGQIKRVYEYMRHSGWRTLDEIAKETGDGQASISAQLRNLRKPRFGGHTVDRKHIGNGLYQYMLIINKS